MLFKKKYLITNNIFLQYFSKLLLDLNYQISYILTADSVCRAAGGSCTNLQTLCNGYFRAGLCPSQAANLCCVPYPQSKNP